MDNQTTPSWRYSSALVFFIFALATYSSLAQSTVPSASLAEAMDTTNIDWVTYSYVGEGQSDALWFAQTNITHDGVDAVQSPDIESGDSYLHATIVGPARVNYIMKLDLGANSVINNEILTTSLDGDILTQYYGENASFDWQPQSAIVPFGTHTLGWSYHTSVPSLGHAWLDELTVTPVVGDAPTIVSQPTDVTIQAGSSNALSVVATGTEPIRYLLLQGGYLNFFDYGRGLTFPFASPSDAGTYRVLVSNAFGMVTSAPVTVTIEGAVPLPYAADATNLIWTTSKDSPWFGQTLHSRDGDSAAEASEGFNSELKTTVVGPGVLSFWWDVLSSDSSAGIGLSFDWGAGNTLYWDGTTNHGWKQFSVAIGPGAHLVKWGWYDYGHGTGAYVDNVHFITGTFSAPKIVAQPLDTAVKAGDSATLRVTAQSKLPITYQWWHNGTRIEDGTQTTLRIQSVGDSDLGPYNVTVANALGSVESATVTVAYSNEVTRILGNVGWGWSYGDAPWIEDRLQKVSGSSSLRSPVVTNGSGLCLLNTVVGPGTLTFWWKVSSEAKHDFLSFYIESWRAAHISGEVGWQKRSVHIPWGLQSISWCYEKDASGSQGLDCGWVDAVTFTLDPPPTVAVVPARATRFYGDECTFRVVTKKPETFFNWFGSQGFIEDATGPTLTVTADENSAGQYLVDVATDAGFAAGEATLSVVRGLHGKRVMEGHDVQMFLATRQLPNRVYQWSTQDGILKNNSRISGAKTPDLTIRNARSSDAGMYSIAASKVPGAVNFSLDAGLTVLPKSALVSWGIDDFRNDTIPIGDDVTLIDVLDVAVADGNGGAMYGDGHVEVWGLGLPANNPGAVKAIAAGDGYVLVLNDDSDVLMFGTDSYGWDPVSAGPGGPLEGVMSISACHKHNLALKLDHTVVAWGPNDDGECTVPDGLSNVVAVAAGGTHSLALQANGKIVAWGNNDFGQLFLPATAVHVKAIAAGAHHCVALRTDGIVVAWGDNSSGQCSVPAHLSDVVAIAAGDAHSVALKRDGTVVAWGGIESSSHTLSSAVPHGLSGVKKISAGGNNTAAVIYAPIIATQPQATWDGTINFVDVDVRGVMPMTYQWRVNGHPIASATDSFLTIGTPPTAAAAAQSRYDVIVRNRWGVAVSQTVTAIPGDYAGYAQTGGLQLDMDAIALSSGVGAVPTANGAQAGVGVLTGRLNVMRQSAGILLLWQDAPGLELEWSSDLRGPFSSAGLEMPSVIGGLKSLKLPVDSPQRFYRLRQR